MGLDSQLSDAPAPMSEKKPPKKWTQEEMMMLVNGYQIVFTLFFSYFGHNYVAWCWKLENDLAGP